METPKNNSGEPLKDFSNLDLDTYERERENEPVVTTHMNFFKKFGDLHIHGGPSLEEFYQAIQERLLAFHK